MWHRLTHQLHAAQSVVHEGVHAAEQPGERDLNYKSNKLSTTTSTSTAIRCSSAPTLPTTRTHDDGGWLDGDLHLLAAEQHLFDGGHEGDVECQAGAVNLGTRVTLCSEQLALVLGQ